MKIIIGITGASGVEIGKKLVEELKEHEVFTIITNGAKKVMEYEGQGFDLKHYNEDEMDAPISSSSFDVDAMVVVPCSVKTLSGIANAYTENLVVRAADNMLKMNKPLVVCLRETPLSLATINNMKKLKEAGAIILPLNIAYYNKPKNIDEVNSFFVGKIMDSLKIKNELYEKWGK